MSVENPTEEEKKLIDKYFEDLRAEADRKEAERNLLVQLVDERIMLLIPSLRPTVLFQQQLDTKKLNTKK